MAVSKEHPSIHRKLALIIGNDNYRKPYNRLNHSNNNVNDLSNVLKTINFDVTRVCDSNKRQLTTAIIDFAKTIKDGDLVLFYFSGHACQAIKKNYIIPIDDNKIENETDIEDFSVNIERTLERLVEINPSYLTVFILDCCKPYLMENASTSNTSTKVTALSEIRTPVGAFVQYACAANQTIRDAVETDRNSLFTKHLLKNIARENVDFTEVFQDITNDVYKESSRKQMPFSINKFQESGSVYFNQVIKPAKQPQPIQFFDDKWDEKSEGNLELTKKAHAQIKAYYDNFPSIEYVTNDKKPEIKEAKAFTDSILQSVPSGNVTERATVCHVLKNMLQAQNIECLFYDSTHGKDLHDSSGILTEISSQERPFILKLNSSDGLGGSMGPKTEHGAIRFARILTESIQNNKVHPVIQDVLGRLSEAHQTDKENISVTAVYVGSFNFAYTVKNWIPGTLESLPKLEKNLKDQFEQFSDAKIHPLLCRPAFDISSFDKQGNKTFPDSSETYQVGPPGRTQKYTSPAGWTRYGLKVRGKYSNGDNWLHPFQDPGNWYRAFHGTGRASAADFNKSKQSFDQQYAPVDAIASIYKTGFRPARVAAFGSGVYCSPDPTFPEKGYVGVVQCDTQQGRKNFKCMLQVAVSPDGVTFASDNSIWVVSNPEDVRPYGILIKEA
ncbi:unnamed protein product [Rotaria socialis]|uniref:Caspase family p20 domain-containing protein n=1 Tax=Rotaria socialis TaxID=392032 RepID=A0A821AJI7_9BILA|nr:unnamed protein product [Rotaria socialis]